MRSIVASRLICWICVASAAAQVLLALQDNNSVNSKSAYIEAAWRRKFHAKDDGGGGANRYANLLKSTSGKVSSSGSYELAAKGTSAPHRTSYSYGDSSDNVPHLRHSRYPNLDGVMTRLDKMKSTTTTTTTKRPTTRTSSTTSHPKEDRNLENSPIDNNLFNLNYQDEDLEDGDEIKEDDYNYEWEDDEDETDKENINEHDDWQAEEATEGTSHLTQYKWEHYGTRNRVEESRRNMNYPEHSQAAFEVGMALQHIVKMDRETKCKEPFPKVLSVQSLHPDPRKAYLPSCTLLHRCAEDTGCCDSRGTICGPRKQTLVELYFYTTTVGNVGSRVEKLSFYNHTECACVNMSLNGLRQLETFSPVNAVNSDINRPYRSGLSVRAADSIFAPPQNLRRCKCPQQYSKRFHQRSEYCSCDCSSDNEDCLSMKRGEEHFSLKDRMCILEKKCGYPTCEHGVYMKHVGRCPRTHERMSAFTNVPTGLN